MKEAIFGYLSGATSALTVEAILVSFIAATVIGVLIFTCYRVTHSRAVYSAKFNVSLLMMTVITTLVMTVIGNNIALSLGMVGALSIIRFRTAIKDVRDTAYIFWCIAVGICCGVSEFTLAAVGSAFIFLVLVLMGAVHTDDIFMIVVRADSDHEGEVMNLLGSFFGGKAKLKVNNSSRDYTEVIYEIARKDFEKKTKHANIADRLYAIESVSMVNVVCQSEEISR